MVGSHGVSNNVLHIDHLHTNAVGGTLWFSPHAAHTGCYVPWPAGYAGAVPASYASTSLARLDRGVSAFHAHRTVFNLAQLRWDLAYADVQALQARAAPPTLVAAPTNTRRSGAQPRTELLLLC